MTLILGFLTVLGLVFGGFVLSGGKFDIIMHALPFEGMMIGGAAIGSFIIANSFAVVKQSLKGVGRVLKGSKWKATDYKDLLQLMYELSRIYKTGGALELDKHIEAPKESEVFQKYPRLLGDHHITEMITGTFRLIGLGVDNSMEVEEIITKQIKKHHHEVLTPAHSLQTMADSLPAIGIVAAVLGIVKTMGSIDKPPTILGAMIGGALVGTFLGVFLSYCLVAPISGRLTQIEEEDSVIFNVIKEALMATAAGKSPEVVVELARLAVASSMMPTFEEMEQAIEEVKA